MNRGLYLAAAGMKTAVTRQDIRANNLANASTAGFKKDYDIVDSYQPVLRSGVYPSRVPAAVLPIPRLNRTATDMQAGLLLDTGLPLDVTVTGPGFLEVGSGADRAYVKTDSLQVVNGILSSSSGKPVIGSRGPIQVGAEDFEISETGEVIADGSIIDKLRIVDAGQGGSWLKTGLGEFIAVGAEPVPVQNSDIRTGTLEQSNVNTITEMVGMIALYRNFEAGQKAVWSIDQTLDKAINEVGRV